MIIMILLKISILYSSDWFLNGKPRSLPSYQDCKFEAKKFSKDFYLNTSCFFSIFPRANERLKAESNDKSHYVMAYNDAIYISEAIKGKNGIEVARRIIAGNKTSVQGLRSIDISEDNEWLVVLDQAGLKIFSTKRHGNIGPSKFIQHESISNASSAKFYPKKDKIIVVNAVENSILFFPSNLDSRHPAQASEIKIIKEFKGANTNINQPADAIVSLKNQELYVLNRMSEEILVFDLKKDGNIEPKQIASDKMKTNRPFRFFYDEESDQFTLINHDYSRVQIKRIGG